MKNALSTLLLVVSMVYWVRGQIDNSEVTRYASSSVQFGFAVKASFEIQKFNNFRLSLAAGVGKRIKALPYFYPAFHSEMQLYTGGIGTPLKYQRKAIYLDFVNSLTLNLGFNHRSQDDFSKIVAPLYYFSDLSANPLQNVYHFSLGIGTNYIISNDPLKEAQQVGFVNLNIDRTGQISYYNDGGPPIVWLFTGDGFDRYYTGGICFALHHRLFGEPTLFELSFHKFTGYIRYAYEFASHLDINYISYKNPQAFYYNQNRWRLSYHSFRQGLGLAASIYNVKGNNDLQNWIHDSLGAAFHPSVFTKPTFALGFNYQYAKYFSK